VVMAGIAAYVGFIFLKTKLNIKLKVAIAVLGLVAIAGMQPSILDAKFWGIVLFGASVMILGALPWLDLSHAKSIRYRPDWHKYVYIVFGISFLTLGYLGTLPPTAGRTLVAQIGTCLYFGFFMLMPWWSAMGKFKPVPNRVTFHPH
jgi:ubiquinol-cytochrome c reductase cytochrome b subunit